MTHDAGNSAAPSYVSRTWRWVDERLGLESLAYPIPAHGNNVLYELGGITLFGVLVLFGTGIYLTQYYNADPSQARESVNHIITSARFGDFVRNVHFWTANLVVITMFLHAVRVFAAGSYRAPRELNWVVGVGLLAIMLGLVFTGTVLKWDQEGWEALQHNQEIGKLLGGVGVWFTPEFTTSKPILERLFIAHVTILPFLLIALVVVHFLLVKYHGISARPGHDERRHAGHTDTQEEMEVEGSVPFSRHLLHILGWGLLLTAVASLLAVAVAAPLGGVIEPDEEKTKPLWMFLPLYPFEDWFGIRALLWVPTVALLGLVAIPFVDRFRSSSLRVRSPLLILGAVVLVALIGLGIYAQASAPAQHIPGAGVEQPSP